MRLVVLLMKRAQDHAKGRKEQDNRSHIAAYQYVLESQGQIELYNAISKEAMSPRVYNMLYAFLPKT